MRKNHFQKINLPREWGGKQAFLWVLGRVLVVLCLVMLFQQRIKAQQTMVYTDEIKFYNRGIELFDKEKYAAAQKHFDWYQRIGHQPLNKINAEYYSAVCAMELFNPDAENLFLQIVNKYPENPKSKLAILQLGKLYYRNKNNKGAVQWLDKFDTKYVSNEALKEYYFIYGYSLFKVERYDDAKKSFAPIKDEKSKYYDATNYYYGYVCYKSGAFDEALEHFGRVKYHKTFGPLASVYIAQVYFARKQYKDVISFCDTIRNQEVANDVAGMVGQSHYLLNQFDQAVPHLEKFMSAAPVVPGANDYYMLGYSYVQTGNYKKAIDQLMKIDSKNDTIAPFVQYNLGISYLKLENKTASRAAFDNCYNLDSTGNLAEPSLFFSAKLSDELGLQGIAMNKYVKFIDKFNDSDYSEEARSNLSNILLNAKNYREAIKILESLKKPNKQDLTNLQRVNYYRAEEYYLNNNYEEAQGLFKKAAKEEYDRKITGLSYFWLSEYDYRNQNYKGALENLKKFQSYPEVKSTRFYNHSFYNQGYDYLKLSDYAKAVDAFIAYESKESTPSNPEAYTDAAIRTADCFFADKKYEKAIEYYGKIIQKELNGADYALYQKALILGVLGRNEEKMIALKTIEKNYPKSPYIDDAVFEMSDIYLKSEEYPKAIESFGSIITNYPRSIYLRKSILNKSLALFNIKKDDEALEEIKKLIINYPNSEEAREALPMVQNIFVNQGKGEEYLNFIRVLPNVVISASSQDSLSYESAFNLYQKENYEKASKGFGTYITRFPGGYFILKANYFKAESDYKQKKYDDALVGYEYVANSLRSEYSERCTRQSAVLLNTRKNYEAAYTYFSALERIASNRDNLQLALLGQMRTCSYLNKVDSAAFASIKYINSGIAQKEGLIEAQTFVGRYYMKQSYLDSAQTAFTQVLKETKNIYGAEAKYNIALIQYKRKEYKTAQKTIFELNDKFSGFDNWVAKGFVLLADTYIQQKDYFQAKATLQSLIDNYDGEDILNECKTKLTEIAELENSQKKESQKQIEQRIKQSEK
ncbi:MAG: tetratricopeptide repeat protein [Bacteroidia bacterium]|nr:tetratricopeptide repeat protein [Bacteroidia bacterium]